MYRLRGIRGGNRRTPIFALTLGILATACTGGSGDTITLTTDSEGVDPTVLEVPVAYIRRPLPEDPPDLRDPLAFSPGARLWVKERAAVNAPEEDITGRILALVATAHWACAVPLNADNGGASAELEADLQRCGADLVIGPYFGPLLEEQSPQTSPHRLDTRFCIPTAAGSKEKDWSTFQWIQRTVKGPFGCTG